MIDAKKQKELVICRLTHLDTVMLAQLTRYGREALGESALDTWMLPVIATRGLLFVGRSGEAILWAAEIARCPVDGESFLYSL